MTDAYRILVAVATVLLLLWFAGVWLYNRAQSMAASVTVVRPAPGLRCVVANVREAVAIWCEEVGREQSN